MMKSDKYRKWNSLALATIFDALELLLIANLRSNIYSTLKTKREKNEK